MNNDISIYLQETTVTYFVFWVLQGRQFVIEFTPTEPIYSRLDITAYTPVANYSNVAGSCERYIAERTKGVELKDLVSLNEVVIERVNLKQDYLGKTIYLETYATEYVFGLRICAVNEPGKSLFEFVGCDPDIIRSVGKTIVDSLIVNQKTRKLFK